ncbi:MAG: PhnD/SsuA/transferrin family substrate-binding protein [Chloroflexota bacterium]
MPPLKITSCQAPIADFVCQAISDYLAHKIGLRAQFIDNISWQEREQKFDRGEIHMSWLCGLPYIRKADSQNPQLALLAAPVMSHSRYQNLPIYFSDVIVHRDSAYHKFADLRGKTWAYNEPQSQSGYNITRYYLAALGEATGYFDTVIEAGAHQISLDMVLNRQVDASAIDSTVLELELAARPAIADQIRVIEVFGPSPIPPWVISKAVPLDLRQAIQTVLLTMHEDPLGQTILTAGQMARFTAITDDAYDVIRDMASKAEGVAL